MTMLVEDLRFPTKRMFREAVLQDANHVWIVDPALRPEWRPYGSNFNPSILKEGDTIEVTNNPKRSWFATVTKRNDKLEVK